MVTLAGQSSGNTFNNTNSRKNKNDFEIGNNSENASNPNIFFIDPKRPIPNRQVNSALPNSTLNNNSNFGSNKNSLTALDNTSSLNNSNVGQVSIGTNGNIAKTNPLNSNSLNLSKNTTPLNPEIAGLTPEQNQFITKVKSKLGDMPAGPDSSTFDPAELGKIPLGNESLASIDPERRKAILQGELGELPIAAPKSSSFNLSELGGNQRGNVSDESLLSMDPATRRNVEQSIASAQELAPTSQDLDSEDFQAYLGSLARALKADPDGALKLLPNQILSSPDLNDFQKKQALAELKITGNRFDSNQNPRLKKAQIGDHYLNDFGASVGSELQGLLTGGEQSLRHFLGLDTNEIDKEAKENSEIAADLDKKTGGVIGKVAGSIVKDQLLGGPFGLIKGVKGGIKTAGKIKHIERLGDTKKLSTGKKAAIGSVTDALTTQEANAENFETKKLTEVLENLPKKFTRKKAENEVNIGSNERVHKRIKKEMKRERKALSRKQNNSPKPLSKADQKKKQRKTQRVARKKS